MCVFKRLPYPEEKPDYSQTLESVSILRTIDKWLVDYKVPIEFRPHWLTRIQITVTNNISYPAQTWEENGVRHLDIRPEYLNSGVIAHEQAHNSYSLLSQEQRIGFFIAYQRLIKTDRLTKLAFQLVPYMQTTLGQNLDVEGHAEVYRYLGSRLPKELYQFYPKLF